MCPPEERDCDRDRYHAYLEVGLDGETAGQLAQEDQLRDELAQLCEADLRRVCGPGAIPSQITDKETV